jgi:anti-anti-sigma regulatory factor
MNANLVVVGNDGNCGYIRSCGGATYVFGEALRNFILKTRAQGIAKFEVDLAECITMDSTFMGVLVMTAIECRSAGGFVFLLNGNDRVGRQLDDLGIKEYFLFAVRPMIASVEILKPLKTTVPGTGFHETVLDAHETLTRVYSPNAAKFGDAIQMIKEELRNSRKRQC